ncbi:MAG: phage portal protein [Pseudomonadota bacterium]|nr:phage portal protein [Pseudomonadota bacterium]
MAERLLMGWLGDLYRNVAPARAAARAEAMMRLERVETQRSALRGIRAQYDGASHSRRTQGWRRTGRDANYELQGAAAILAQTARDMVRNNPYAERAVSAISTDLVGTGITFQVLRDGEPDAELTALAREHLESTACDADGRQNIYGMQLQAARTVVESGAVLARNRPRFARDGLPVPFQVQMLEPDYLDATRNGVFDAGMYVSGIQFDRIGNREAYWLFPQHPGSVALRSPTSNPIPARDVVHVFRADRPGQQHGASWFAPVILPMQDFRDYQDAQLLRQKVASSWAVFRIGSPESLDDAQEEGDRADFIEPGLIEDLPYGTDIKFANPPGVDGYAEFSKISVRTFATGMNLPYDNFGDLEGVNYSSGRMGRIQYNRQLDSWTWNMLIPQFCEPIGAWFFRAAQLLGRDVTGCTMKWTPPARPMLDLSTEGPAIRDMVRSGLMDPETAIRERGEDPDTVLAAWARFAAKADALGLVFDCDPRKVTQVGNAMQPTAGTQPKKV